MDSSFKAVKISDSVFWVGAVDWDIRDFHGYATKRGSTYNAFLVMADKITLVDAVKKPFHAEMMSRIASVVDPSKIEWFVSNHSEMDHSGSLDLAFADIKPKRIFASKMGVKGIQANLHQDFQVEAVDDGGSLDLGGKTLQFIETKMLHWPDSMFSFLPEESLLFSQDAFGMHMASSERFDDQIPKDQLEWEAKKYYANIITPYSDKVLELAARLGKLGWKIKTIATDHGPVWRGDAAWIVGKYVEWATQKPKRKAVVTYDTMWDSTHQMARAIAEGVATAGISMRVMNMKAEHRSDIMTEILDSGAIIAGTPTLNRTMFPTVADVLTYVKGLAPAHKIGMAFGSYGWSGEAVKQAEDMLKDTGVEIVEPPIKVKYVPTKEDLAKCYEVGASFGAKLAERADAV